MVRSLKSGTIVYASSSGGDADLVAASDDDLAFIAPSLAAVSRSSGSVFLIDPTTLGARMRIPVGEGPHDIASSEDGRTAIVPLLGRFPAPHEKPIRPSRLRWVSRPSAGFTTVDLVTGEHETFPMENCREPHGAAITPQGRRAWITCEDVGEIREVDPQTGETLNIFRTAKGVHKVMLLTKKNMLAASNPAAGETYLIDLANGEVATFKTGAGSEGIAASQDEGVLWVAQNASRTVCSIDVDARRRLECYPTGGVFPIALAVDEAAETLWILHNSSSDLTAMSLSTGEIKEKAPLPSPPLGLAFDAVSRRLYATMPRRNEIAIIDADTLQILKTMSGVMEGDDLDLIPNAHFRSP
ncbi:MAG: YncE family protein, partial [Hyphococcus sp.]